MTAKEYLQQAYYLDREIKLLNERILDKRSDMYNITQMYQRNGGGKNNNFSAFDGILQEVMDNEAEMREKTAELFLKRLEIEKVIDSVKNQFERKVLIMRYLKYKKWDKIATEMNYSNSHLYEVHTNALKNIVVKQSKT